MALQDRSSSSEESSRKRKPHKKSRRGCRNCKLRRVKCDEHKPECTKCIGFGVTCNFNPRIPDLQLVAADPAVVTKNHSHQFINAPFYFNPSVLGDGKIEVPRCISPDVTIGKNPAAWVLDGQNLGLLHKFHSRTILTLGTSRLAPIYRDIALQDAFMVKTLPLPNYSKLTIVQHPFLMHIVLALVSIHDRHLSSNWKPTVTELEHWSTGASLLNKKLSQGWPPEDRDSLWTAAALLGAIAFSSIQSGNVEETWPLKEADASDLQWLRMSDGKMIIWEISNPLRPESKYHDLAVAMVNENLYFENQPFKLDNVPFGFLSLYDLDRSSTNKNNPYFDAIKILSQLLPIEPKHDNMVKYLSFVSHTGNEFKRLVERKDPRALLLLSYWFAKLRRGMWWAAQRAFLEGRAICIYLQRYHSYDTAIKDLLQFPKMELGLLDFE